MSGAKGHRRKHRGQTDRARRSRRIFVAVSALLLAFLIVPALLPTGFGPAEIAEAAIQKAKSFLQLMQSRSPGHRTRGMLVKTKHRHVAAMRSKPHERALAKVVYPPILPPGPPGLFELVAPPLAPKFASVEAMPIPPIVGQPSPPIFLLPPPAGGFFPPTETPPTPPPPPPPPPPVPEPGTWATMLLGFAFIGWQMRRRPQGVTVLAD